MVLHHIADGSGLVVETAAALDTKILGHGDLHARDVRPVPERLQKGIRKARVKDAVDRPLAQVMIDAKDGPLLEGAEQNRIQGSRGFQIGSERLLNDDSRFLGAAGFAELLYDRPEENRGDGQVVRGPSATPQSASNAGEG